MTRQELERRLDQIRRRQRLLVFRAVVAGVSDSQGLQLLKLQGLPGEVLEGVERFQAYGFASRPLEKAEAIAAAIAGARSHVVALQVDDRRYRPRDLPPGASAQYALGACRITCFPDGRVRLERILPPAAVIEIGITGEISVTAALAIALTSATEITLAAPSVVIQGKEFLTHQHEGVESGDDVSGGVA